jgi:hypothetical protein
MVAYLSVEWVEALDRALAAVEPPSEAPDLVVEYVVEDGDGGEVAYHLSLAASGARAYAGRPERSDVRFRQTRPIAEAVGRGQRSAQLAVLRGEVQVEGDASRLLGWRRALAGQAVAAALEGLAATTDH